MEEDCELACHRHGGALLGSLSAATRQLQAVAAEIAVCPESPEEAVRSLHEQPTQSRIPSLADPKLWVAVAGGLDAGAQAEPRADAAAAAKPLRVFEREHEGHRDRGPHPVDLLQVTDFRVVLLRDLGETLLERPDASRQ